MPEESTPDAVEVPKKKGMLGDCGCCLAELLLIIFLIIWPAALIGKFAAENLGKVPWINGPGGGQNTLTYPSDVEPGEIKDCLEEAIKALQANSPLKGEWFANAGRANNVSPALLIAIAKKETNLATSYDYSQPNPNGGQYNVGNIRPSPPIQGQGFANYSSYEEGINALGNLIGNKYIRGNPPLATVESIGRVYAPSSENDTDRWVSQVKTYMQQIYTRCPESQPMHGEFFPLPNPFVPENNFAASRGNRTHAGVDIYAENGTPVYAIKDGVIVNYYQFTGPVNGQSDGYNTTYCILVDHGDYVINYGEVSGLAPGLAVGSQVTAGQQIGQVGLVTRNAMLHLEQYTPGVTVNESWPAGSSKPPHLIDPTPLLNSLLNNRVR